jgi:hypothetical protein
MLDVEPSHSEFPIFTMLRFFCFKAQDVLMETKTHDAPAHYLLYQSFRRLHPLSQHSLHK